MQVRQPAQQAVAQRCQLVRGEGALQRFANVHDVTEGANLHEEADGALRGIFKHAVVLYNIGMPALFQYRNFAPQLFQHIRADIQMFHGCPKPGLYVFCSVHHAVRPFAQDIRQLKTAHWVF